LIVIQATDFYGAMFHHGFSECYLSISSNSDCSSMSD
jgi:hypothetical protein